MLAGDLLNDFGNYSRCSYLAIYRIPWYANKNRGFDWDSFLSAPSSLCLLWRPCFANLQGRSISDIT